jgi:hypothetical protein
MELGACKMENVKCTQREEIKVIYEAGSWTSDLYKKKYARILREIYDAIKITRIFVKKSYYEKYS